MAAPTDDTAALAAIAAALGVDVREPVRWREALTHPSYVHEHTDAGASYERLEFLGDALLNAAVAEILVQERPASPEGELSFLRSVLVRRDALVDWLQTLPVGDALRLGAGAQQLQGTGRATIEADVAEALLAVVYLEHGWPALVQAVRAGLAREIPDYTATRRALEPKSVLQEELAAAGAPTPAYRIVARDEDVTAEVAWAGGSARGRGRNRREAESAAARRALDTIARRQEVTA